MRALESHRAKGRDEYPVRAVWNSILAGIVFQHNSVESLRRELKRNDRLRWLWGFDIAKGEKAVPPSWVYTRFFALLFKNAEYIEQIFDELVEQLRKELPGFGNNLAMDGKAINTHARPGKRLSDMSSDGRRDTDADFGKKTYAGVRDDGTTWQKVVKWFGYKLHLIVDADYELPVAFELTKDSCSEMSQGRKLVKKLKERHEELVKEDFNALIADKGLDDTKLIEQLWVYDYQGNVYCYCPGTGERRAMALGRVKKNRRIICEALCRQPECLLSRIFCRVSIIGFCAELAWRLENRVLFVPSCHQLIFICPIAVKTSSSLQNGISAGAKNVYNANGFDK